MNVRTETRVRYYQPGILFPEETTRTAPTGVDPADWARENAPYGAFAFTLSTVMTADPVPDGCGGTFKVTPKTVNETGRYYLGGRLFDRDEVAALDQREHPALLANMRGNDWDTLILCSTGNWQPFTSGDVLLGAES